MREWQQQRALAQRAEEQRREEEEEADRQRYLADFLSLNMGQEGEAFE